MDVSKPSTVTGFHTIDDLSVDNESPKLENKMKLPSTELELKDQSPVVRRNLVNSAVLFLTNPRMKQHPQPNITGFLKTKGLNDEEISIAFAEAHKQETSQPSMPLMVPPRDPYEPSFFTYARAGLPFFVIVSGFIYGCSHMYQEYLKPFLTGDKKENPMQESIDLQKSLIEEVKAQRTSVDELISLTRETRDVVKNLAARETSIDAESKKKLEDILSSVIAIRNMSLSRKSFKSIPAAPSLPDWQILPPKAKRAASLNEDSKEENRTNSDNSDNNNFQERELSSLPDDTTVKSIE